jgi:hypothetical protein
MARAGDIVTDLYTVVWNEGDLGAVERLVAPAYTIHLRPGRPLGGADPGDTGMLAGPRPGHFPYFSDRCEAASQGRRVLAGRKPTKLPRYVGTSLLR